MWRRGGRAGAGKGFQWRFQLEGTTVHPPQPRTNAPSLKQTALGEAGGSVVQVVVGRWESGINTCFRTGGDVSEIID
jgi:hypothetical protein